MPFSLTFYGVHRVYSCSKSMQFNLKRTNQFDLYQSRLFSKLLRNYVKGVFQTLTFAAKK